MFVSGIRMNGNSEMPGWLPALLEVDPWDVDTYNNLYEVFCSQIRDVVLSYRGSVVWFYKDFIVDGKEDLFWHLTSRKPRFKDISVPRRKRKFAKQGVLREQTERLPDLRRSERLCWVNPLISHWYDPEVLNWDYCEDDGSTNTYLWLKELNFVVIMEKRRNRSRLLITSYYVDSDWTIKDFERKYRERVQ